MSLVKLVITDIDNTIVPKHKSLSQRALKCIHQLKDKGIYFGLASGRSVEEIRRIIKRWHLQNVDCIVYLNGCGLYDALSDKKYEYYKMKKEWIKETLEFMKQFDANPIMYYKDHLLTKRLDSIVQMSAQSDEDFYRDEAAKIMYRVKPETMPVIEKYLMENPSNHYIGYKTQNTLIEFSDQRVSKA